MDGGSFNDLQAQELAVQNIPLHLFVSERLSGERCGTEPLGRRNVVRQMTGKGRFTRAVRAVHDCCKANRHQIARRPATTSCTGDPGPLRLRRSDGEQQTS